MEGFPYSNFHDLNLDWILKQFKDLGLRVDAIEKALEDQEPILEIIDMFYAIAYGTDRNGDPLPDTSEFYHNNCEYFMEVAELKAREAGQSATSAAQSVLACQAAQAECQRILNSIPEDYTQLSQDVIDLKSALTLYDDGLIPVKPDTSEWYRGYFSSSGGFVSTTTNATPTNTPFLVQAGDVYIIEVNGLYAQVQTFSYSGGVYTRTSNNVYTSDKTLTFDSDTYLSIHVQKSNGSTLTLDKVTTKIYKKSKTQKQIDSLSDDIDTVDDKATAVGNEFNSIASKQYSTYQIASYSEATKIAGYSFGTVGTTLVSGSENASYDSYYFYTDTETAMYFASAAPSSPYYIALTVGFDPSKNWVTAEGQKQMSCTGATRKRKSENNLPVSSSSMNVSNAIVIITINANTDVSFFMNDVYKIKESALPSTAESKKPLLKYSSSSNGSLQVLIPNVVGYVRYNFVHGVDLSINADIWRVSNAVHIDDNYSQDYEITATGEWEVAIKISGRSDFAGGIIHGDEVKTCIAWVVDGKPVDITAYTNYTEFDTLFIAEQSNLYDPNDSTTVFAKHNSIHIFNKTGLTIKQVVEFVQTETINAAYMAMLPIAQSVSDKIVTNKDFIPVDTSNKLYTNVSEVFLYDSDKAIQTHFYVPKFNFLDSTTFICNDNGGTSYNKCYFVNVIADRAISSGTVWESESRYEFVTGNED